MTTYSFDSITAAQAATFEAGDSLSFSTGSATGVTVVYASATEIDIIHEGRTVSFSSQLASDSQSNPFVFPDGTKLMVGDDAANKLANVTAIFGGGGNDTISGGVYDHPSLIQGNAGEDSVTAISNGSATVYGGQGDDSVSLVSVQLGAEPPPIGSNFVQGNKGNDTLIALGRDSDTILGGQGDDAIQDASSGANFLNGNLGNDTIYAFGNDLVFGEGGDDTINAANILSEVHGGDGDDRIDARGLAFGDVGNDCMTGGTFAGPASTLDGGQGDDFIASDLFGRMVALGGAGNDTIGSSQAAGGDTLDGGTGNDRLVSNGGGEVMTGGPGQDIFVVTGGRPVTAAGADTITDWSPVDTLHFNSLPAGPVFYTTAIASDFTAALAIATQAMAVHTGVVGVQVGADVYVFGGDADGKVDVAAELVGRGLVDLLPGQIV